MLTLSNKCSYTITRPPTSYTSLDKPKASLSEIPMQVAEIMQAAARIYITLKTVKDSRSVNTHIFEIEAELGLHVGNGQQVLLYRRRATQDEKQKGRVKREGQEAVDDVSGRIVERNTRARSLCSCALWDYAEAADVGATVVGYTLSFDAL